jgi:hypothetical protein
VKLTLDESSQAALAEASVAFVNAGTPGETGVKTRRFGDGSKWSPFMFSRMLNVAVFRPVSLTAMLMSA